jgi:hypothetical protein
VRKYPVPSVRVVVGGKVVLGRLQGGETWLDAVRARVRESLKAEVIEEKFLGLGEPIEKDGEWWLPAEFEAKI